MKRTTRRRLRNGFIAFWHGLPRALLFLPITLLMLIVYGINWIVLLKSTWAKCGKIRITTLEKDHALFTNAALDALALIEKHDRRRFVRLQKEVRFITDGPLTSTGCYHREYRECVVDFDKTVFDWSDFAAPHYAHYRAWHVAALASTFIHEGTHTHLHTLGIPYTKETRVQSERICVAEARRFAARLPQTPHNFAADLVTPFDPKHWEASWNATLFQPARNALRRIKERSKHTEAQREPEPQTAQKASVPTIFSNHKTAPIPPKAQDDSIWPKNAPPASPGAPVAEMPPCAAFKLLPPRRRKRR